MREGLSQFQVECVMSFGLGHGRQLDPAMGVVAVGEAELPPLPDAIAHDPEAGRLDPRRWFPDPPLPFEVEIGTGRTWAEAH